MLQTVFCERTAGNDRWPTNQRGGQAAVRVYAARHVYRWWMPPILGDGNNWALKKRFDSRHLEDVAQTIGRFDFTSQGVQDFTISLSSAQMANK
jgi:hypothetical protein